MENYRIVKRAIKVFAAGSPNSSVICEINYYYRVQRFHPLLGWRNLYLFDTKELAQEYINYLNEPD